MLWGGNTEFENAIQRLKQIFHIDSEHKQIFEDIGVKLEQKPNFSIIMN